MLLNARKIIREDEEELILLAIEDITERKKAEVISREAREYAQNIVATVREPLIILDKNLRVVSAGDSFYTTFQVKPEETEGQLLYDLGNGQWDIPILRVLLEEVLPAKKTVEDYEIEHNFESIGQKAMLLNARKIIREDEEELILLAIEDISNRKKVEAEIKQINESLEQKVRERTIQIQESNKELEAFAYSVSHDLRAPLRAIGGFSQMIIEDYADKIDAEGKRKLNVVRDNASEMGQLIDALLAFSRLSRTDMKSSMIDMEALVNEAFDKLNVSAKSATLTVRSLPDAFGDRILLLTVIINLLSNAVKFTKPGCPATIEVTSSVQGNETIYSVKDDGVGFDMTYVDKIFQVFQRLHSSRDFEGTGIGLALVHRIIQRSGGRVWAEGHVNDGATIYFTIPQQEEMGNEK